MGKSSALDTLKGHFEGNHSVLFVDEPVDLWVETGLLGALYTNDLHPGAFQVMALATVHAAARKAFALARKTGATLIISERGRLGVRPFASANLEGAARTNFDVAETAELEEQPNAGPTTVIYRF